MNISKDKGLKGIVAILEGFFFFQIQTKDKDKGEKKGFLKTQGRKNTKERQVTERYLFSL